MAGFFGGAGMKTYRPQKIYIERRAAGFALTRNILARLPEVPVEEVEDARALQEKIRLQPDAIGAGKRALLLAYDPGRSFKPFPESEQYLSCDYFTLHLAEGCDLECSYCILQAYLTNPLITVFVNVEEILAGLEAALNENPGQFFRIGTGQLTDSLSLDPITGLTEILVPFFAGRENAILELKTKSNQIGNLLRLSSRGKTIVSWSLNSAAVQKEEEHKTATLDERLEAAEQICRMTDHRVGFHFDPLIDYPGWEKDYEAIAEELFARIPAEKIAWISLGCLRFMPSLKPIMDERFPKSTLAQAEWVRGMDGKMRYFKPRRVEMYRRMSAMIAARAPQVTQYLSMESPEVWKLVFGGEHSKESVCRLLDGSARKAAAEINASPNAGASPRA